MLPYARTADDESFTGQPLMGQTWRRWASSAQHHRQGRAHVVASGLGMHPLHLAPAIPQYIEVPFQAAPWEAQYRSRAVVACRTYTDGLTARLYVSSDDPTGVTPSAAQPGGRFSPLVEGEVQDGSRPVATPPPSFVQWPILPDTPPQLVRLQSDWVVHEPAAGLLLLRDRVIRLTVQWVGAPVGAYLVGWVVEGYTDEEVL